MSDPLSNREIEDVLSSIRRLVTQGDPAQPTALHAGSATEKLVLTPAFRVAPAPTAEEAASSFAKDGGAVSAAAAPGDVVEGDGAASDAAAIDAAEHGATVSDPAPAAVPGPTAAAGAAPETSLSLEATIAELEAAISAYGGPFEPDGGDVLVPSPASADAAVGTGQPDVPSVAPLAGPTVAEAPDHAAPAAATGATPDAGPAGPATPAPEAWNVQPFAPARRPEPPGAAPAATAAEPGAEPDAASAPEADADAPLLEDRDEGLLLDEALLRELVTDILREELQGALGQRITRNVRKLVRAEIARALASRDLG